MTPLMGKLTTCSTSGMLYMSSNLTHVQICKDISKLLLNVTLFGQGSDMNLSLLQRPKKINKGTKTMYVYHPLMVTSSDKLEPGDPLKILDVFQGATTSETTLKVIKADDWHAHKWGRGVKPCVKEYESPPGEAHILCDCEKELSEMEVAFKEKVHYVLLSDVGK